ncbi:MAG TPA: hypothetical protein VGO89_18415 [Streptomyces sp.]|nr:hypothetical protein [Streptomyces sp.]
MRRRRLIKGQRLLSLLRESAAAKAVVSAFRRQLAELPWAVYDVRRTLSPRADGQANHARSVGILDVGTRVEMRARLEQRGCATAAPVIVGDPSFPDDSHGRVWLHQRQPARLAERLATAEQYLVVAPATAASKTGPAFARAWDASFGS